MNKESLVDFELKEISKKYVVPPELEITLKNALMVRIEVENDFNDSEKERLPYVQIKRSIDAHIGVILLKCHRKTSAS